MKDIAISRPGNGSLYIAHKGDKDTVFLLVRDGQNFRAVRLNQFIEEESCHTVPLSNYGEPVYCDCQAFTFRRGCVHLLLVTNHLSLESGNVGNRKAI